MLKKLSLSWRMGIYHLGGKCSIGLHALVYLGLFFLGFILNQQNGFGNTLCLACVDNRTTKTLSSFKHPRLLSCIIPEAFLWTWGLVCWIFGRWSGEDMSLTKMVPLGRGNNGGKLILSIGMGYPSTSALNSICCLSSGNCIHQSLLYMSKNHVHAWLGVRV